MESPSTTTPSAESRRSAQVAYGRALETVLGDVGADPPPSEAAVLAWLWRQRPVGVTAMGEVELACASERCAARARAHAGLARLERRLRELGLAAGVVPRVIEQTAAAAPDQPPWSRRVAYMPSFLACTTLPHREPRASSFTRKHGLTTMSLRAPARTGLPFGIYARLIVIELTTAAITYGAREFSLARSVTQLLGWMGIRNSGGPRGPANRVRDQIARLCATTVTTTRLRADDGVSIPIIEEWATRDPDGVRVTLGGRFFGMVRQSAIPLDHAVVRQLGSSALAIDTYAWLTYGTHSLAEPKTVGWAALSHQFGAAYERPRDFIRRFEAAFVAVKEACPDLAAEARARGVSLEPRPPAPIDRPERERLRQWLNGQ